MATPLAPQASKCASTLLQDRGSAAVRLQQAFARLHCIFVVESNMPSRPLTVCPQLRVRVRFAGLALGLAMAPAASAQLINDSREHVAFDSPEGWAMAWVTSSSLMTGFGGPPTGAPGRVFMSVDFGSIPHLSTSQQRVGFGGLKDEDLNKSPLFGRLRLGLKLPARWHAELGWTPPLRIDGARARDLFALAVGRSLIERDRWRWTLRLHGQHGQVQGDITCPRALAGNPDRSINRYGCIEASTDRIALRYYALESSFAWGPAGGLRGHASLGLARFEPVVQVEARSANLISRPRLNSSGEAPYFALGVSRPLSRRWEAAVEALYVPLQVERRDRAGENDPYWSLRLQLRYRGSD
jgi:hypothetical protein